MADISIIKLKVRRGTDSQRKLVVLDQGEVGYTTDTQRLFIGDGATFGGTVAGNRGLQPLTQYLSLSNTSAQIGDIASAGSLLYMLTGTDFTRLSGWGYIGNSADNITIGFDASNRFQLKDNSITTAKFNTAAIGNGINTTGGTLNAALNTAVLEFSGGLISVKTSGITERALASSAFSNGLQGGSGTTVSLKVGSGSGLGFDNTNSLILCSYPSGSVTYSTFNPNSIGNGLVLNNTTQKLEATLSATDGVSIYSTNGTVQLPTRPLSGSYELPFFRLDGFGIPTQVASSIYETLTGVSVSTQDGVPVGTILPHAAAIGSIPAGYLLCDGGSYSRANYNQLFTVIGTQYGSFDSSTFSVPSLTANQILYGIKDAPSIASTVYGVSASSTLTSTLLSAVATNFIIKASTSTTGIFNGNPSQMSNPGTLSFYTAVDNAGSTVTLSSAGFITFAGGVSSRNTNQTVNRFAIPIFNY